MIFYTPSFRYPYEKDFYPPLVNPSLINLSRFDRIVLRTIFSGEVEKFEIYAYAFVGGAGVDDETSETLATFDSKEEAQSILFRIGEVWGESEPKMFNLITEVAQLRQKSPYLEKRALEEQLKNIDKLSKDEKIQMYRDLAISALQDIKTDDDVMLFLDAVVNLQGVQENLDFLPMYHPIGEINYP